VTLKGCCYFIKGNKQKWVPISIELPKSSRARKNWQARRDQLSENAGEGHQTSAGVKDDTANFRRRDDGHVRQGTARKSDGSPRKDRKEHRDVADRGGRDHGRPNSASAKAPAAPVKKGKFMISVR